MQFSSFFISLVLCPLIILISQKFKLFDLPNKRKSHTKPTPKLGGLAIFLAFLIDSLLNNFFEISLSFSSTILIILVLLDDKYNLNRYLRLVVQILATIPILLHFNLFDLNFIILLFSSFFIIYSINIFNFFDGLNGLLITQLLLVSSFYLNYGNSLGIGNYTNSIASVSLAGISFLLFNLGGLIFMGDIGSCFLGLFISNVVLKSIHNGDIVSFVCLLIPLLPIFVDCSLIILTRFKNREKFFSTPHNQHTYQLLNRLGFKHWMVNIIYIVKYFIYIIPLYLYKEGIGTLNYLLFNISILIILDLLFCSFIRKVSLKQNIL
ncbi:glycosyltransferase family 4 protein [Prochlorococcus marinus]|uniref:glycosyltransferase family 4 protein n=1 Tax=Prochlorococcus marinus TaxID=1219 RepID=UPI001AD97CE0|nr:hypothetical protein [Prochlorococcus marinus]MBO8219557.1 hypothetical protein [Prochlorococcus marinus CUG1416]